MPPKILNRSLSFVSHAVQRRLNTKDFIQVNRTPYEVLYHKDLMSLRYYAPLNENRIEIEGLELAVTRQTHGIPLLLVPPLGVYAWVFDLLVKRSFVRYLLAHGYRVYMVDWGQPTTQDAHVSLKNYVLDWLPKAIDATRKHAYANTSAPNAERPISLLGYCMGGLLSLLYTAMGEDKGIANLVTIASPIDFHEQSLIKRLATVLGLPLGMAHRVSQTNKLRRLRHRFYHLRGKSVARAFQLTNPLMGVRRYLDLLRNMADREYVIAYMSISEWFSNMTDFPGATLEEITHKFGIHNQMAQGQVKIGDKIMNFSNIDSRLLAIAGDNDALVNADAAKKILELVNSKDKSFKTAPGGHAGVFGGRSACTHSWQLCEQWLATRSG